MEEYTVEQLEYISGMRAMYTIMKNRILKAKVNGDMKLARALEDAQSVLLLDRLSIANSFVGVNPSGEKLNIDVPNDRVEAYIEGCARAELILIENLNPCGKLTFEEEMTISNFISKSVDRLKELRKGEKQCGY